MSSVSKQGLLTAYRRLLKPLVRILIRNGVSFAEFEESAKLAFLDAIEDGAADDRPSSRVEDIAVITGLEEAEVKRIAEKRLLPAEELDTDLHRMVALIHEWNTAPEYTGPYGIPIELDLKGGVGRPGFADLVKKHFKDETKVEEVLQELVRTNAVEETESGWYRVIVRDYILMGDSPEAIDSLIDSLQNYVEVLDHNMRNPSSKDKFFERQVYTENGISPENLPRFERFFYHRARTLLEEIDNWLALQDQPDQRSDNPIKTGLAIYHYVKKD